jgi:glycosyltransferase involved in cell wall biosynthesis
LYDVAVCLKTECARAKLGWLGGPGMQAWGRRRGGVVLPPLGERPFCSIVIPCYQEEAHIEAVVRAAANQRWPAELLEIFVVDGGSTDRTRAIVRELASADPRVVLLDNPRRFQSAGMNVAIRRARGDVIIRMDAHAQYDTGYVAAAVDALRRTGALNVGGPVRLLHRTRFQQALCAALGSPLGVGGSPSRNPSREGFVESVWGGAFRRETFELCGMFDPAARTNEDAELNQRILSLGGTVYQSRALVSYYYPRASLEGVVRQYFGYGAGRARTLLRRGRPPSLRPLVPFTMLFGFVVLATLAVSLPALRAPLALAVGAYALLVLLEALRVGRAAGPGLWPIVATIFPAMHVAHGVGFAVGLLRHARTNASEPEPERLAIR